MKSAEARDLTVKRVAAAFKKWPEFLLLPELDKADPVKTVRTLMPIRAELDGTGKLIMGSATYPQKEYVEALHSACARGVPEGRISNEIVSKKD